MKDTLWHSQDEGSQVRGPGDGMEGSAVRVPQQTLQRQLQVPRVSWMLRMLSPSSESGVTQDGNVDYLSLTQLEILQEHRSVKDRIHRAGTSSGHRAEWILVFRIPEASKHGPYLPTLSSS